MYKLVTYNKGKQPSAEIKDLVNKAGLTNQQNQARATLQGSGCSTVVYTIKSAQRLP